jgi:hypothetical protein
MPDLFTMKTYNAMLSFISLSVQDRGKTTIENLQAVFLEGVVYGLYAPRAALLKPLLGCISGQRSSYKGDIVYNNGPLAGQVSYTDCQSQAVVYAIDRKKARKLAAYSLPLAAASSPRAEYKSFPASGPQPVTAIDFSKNIALLHDLRRPGPGCPANHQLNFLEQHAIPPGNIVVISGHVYSALRNTCDFIYLFDKKRFPIVVEKADFAMFDHYFENVFSR